MTYRPWLDSATEELGEEWVAAMYESHDADHGDNVQYAATAHRLCEDIEYAKYEEWVQEDWF